ncbi:MAG: hypothetical protein M3071_09310 [Actinomycetota bacterium]|nr:hypothetical protein [Actinomycetota bacterium]
MTGQAAQLHATADGQVAELIGLISAWDEAALRRACAGREKLGDGTVGAFVRHTADNYARIAGFVQTSDRMSAAHTSTQHASHRIPRFQRAFGHGPADHVPGVGQHDDPYTATGINLDAVVAQLATARSALGRIAELTDSQLEAIPPQDSFRFCDGQRTLEQVLAGLLKHQRHQLDALTATTR